MVLPCAALCCLVVPPCPKALRVSVTDRIVAIGFSILLLSVDVELNPKQKASEQLQSLTECQKALSENVKVMNETLQRHIY